MLSVRLRSRGATDWDVLCGRRRCGAVFGVYATGTGLTLRPEYRPVRRRDGIDEIGPSLRFARTGRATRRPFVFENGERGFDDVMPRLTIPPARLPVVIRCARCGNQSFVPASSEPTIREVGM